MLLSLSLLGIGGELLLVPMNNHVTYNFLILVLALGLFACGKDTGLIMEDEEPVKQFNPVVEEALAFPGAEGFGKETTGGRGGIVIKVTNLNDAGPGSLRAAIDNPQTRIVVFDVAGYIELQSNLVIRNGNLTIAGQTAPGDGITIKNHSVIVNADNVIIRFMRFRVGDQGGDEADAMEGRFRERIIIDHCSMSWGTDETGSFYGNRNFTLSWCILSESLTNSIHEKGRRGYAGIWGGNNASFHHNLIAHNNNRNPRLDHPGVYPSPLNTGNLRGVVDLRNNVVYNWGDDLVRGGEAGSFNLVNNYFRPGPASRNTSRFLNAWRQSTSNDPVFGFGSFYVSGNVMEGRDLVNQDNWLGVVLRDGTLQDKAALQRSVPFPSFYGFSQSAVEGYEKVLEFAGASMIRDAVDVRIIQEVRNRSFFAAGSRGSNFGLIDSQEDVGGYPVLRPGTVRVDSDGDGMPDAWEISNGLDPFSNDARARNLSTAYDNIEVYINSLVKDIIERQYR